MSNLLIIGAGSFSTEIEELARLFGYDDIAFLDDNSDIEAKSGHILEKQ